MPYKNRDMRLTEKAFRHAKTRCLDLSSPAFAWYGKRGIRFRFSSVKDLVACIGVKPKGKSLDRIDNNGHYEPGNVRWATPADQARNRRSTKLKIEDVNEIRKLASIGVSRKDLEAMFSVSKSTIQHIINLRKWKPLEETK
jgi:hypothetical protein